MVERRQLALVTGGSRGIGRAVVLELAARGFDVAFCYHSNETAARPVAAEAERLGARAHGVRCDVADSAAARAWIAAVERELGPIEAVVNSAGITRDRALVMMSDEEWGEVIATNLTATFTVCRATAFGMSKRRRGCIVNLSSVSGVYGNATQANYAASKAGVIGFSRSLAKELGPLGIRINVVAPGLIDTDMTAALQPARIERMVAALPLRRLGTSEEVAKLVGFLVSDDARYITGQVMGVDGGLVL
jgi:3-oxoacyl-[acyl-carrier protein] reductase